MVKSICIFEDEKASQLYPLTLTRPVFDLRCGFTTLKEKILRHFPLAAVSLHCREYLQEVIREQNPDQRVNERDAEECLFINGRLLAKAQFLQSLDTERECIYWQEGHVVAAMLRGDNLRKVNLEQPVLFNLKNWRHIERVETQATLICYPWELVNRNAQEIAADFAALGRGGKSSGTVHESAVLLNAQGIYLGAGSQIRPGVVLDAEDGPIYIGNNTTIMANAVIEGPAFIGDQSMIKVGAKIYAGTSIGEVCKVGGELEECIVHSHSNKQHEGFLGHAYLGQWVNLGADTNNSDLKNNYGSVKVHINGELVDSGETFVGLFVGDHSKAGINTMFNTGTVVGVMSNVFGQGFPPKFVPSFAWGGSERLVTHEIEKALDTARRVMARRNAEMTQAGARLFREIYRLTDGERAGF